MSISSLLQQSALALAVLVMFGILVHDTKLDKATAVALAVPMAIAGFELGAHIPRLSNEGHTHIERVSLSNAVRDLHAGTPRIQPRNDHKRYTLQKNVTKGVHAFDGYYMPLGQI